MYKYQGFVTINSGIRKSIQGYSLRETKNFWVTSSGRKFRKTDGSSTVPCGLSLNLDSIKLGNI